MTAVPLREVLDFGPGRCILKTGRGVSHALHQQGIASDECKARYQAYSTGWE